MENLKKIERDLMSEEEFKQYLEDNRQLITYYGITKFKSINRAIKRGHMALNGMIFPSRPFHNRKNTCNRKNKHSRQLNEERKRIYGWIRETEE